MHAWSAEFFNPGQWLCRSHVGVDIIDNNKIEKNEGTKSAFVARLRKSNGKLSLDADYGKRTRTSRFSVSQENGTLFVMLSPDLKG